MNIILTSVCRNRHLFAYCPSKSGTIFNRSAINETLHRYLHSSVQPRFRTALFGGCTSKINAIETKAMALLLRRPKYLLFSSSHVKQFTDSQVLQNKSPFNVNTNVVKDVILFRYENGSFYRILNIFAVCQFLFWMYLSHFSYTSLKDTPVDRENQEDLPWWRKFNLGDNKYRNGLTVICFIIGYGILTAAWAFTLKSVRFLILRKGGESVTFVTYGPYGKNRMITVPMNKVSCQEGRSGARVQLPVKVKGTYLYYMLDMRGEFTNPHLFDSTVGLKRPW